MEKTVEFGRRKGMSKSACGMEPHPEFRFQGNEDGTGMLDIRSVKVLSRDDWNRIQYNMHRREIEAAERLKARQAREEIKAKSQELVKNWTNTVMGARQKKLEDRNKRLAKEEDERVAQDIEEAKYQAEKRRAAIEKAKLQQYYQTDRVKNFHSALLLTETLKEREAQLELKRLKEQASIGQDEIYVKNWREELEKDIEREQERQADRIRKTRETASYQHAQMQKTHEDRHRERDEFLREGDEVKRLAMAYALEKQRLDEIAKEEQKQLMKNNLQQIDDCHRMRQIEKLREEEDDEECRLFAAAKKKMIRLRLEREREMYQDKQDSLNKIKEKLAAQMAAKVNDEEDRTQNAIREKEEKLRAEEEEKERKRQQMIVSINDHRLDHIRRAEEEARARKQAEMDAVRARKDADEIFRHNEALKRQKQFAYAQRVADYQLSQASNDANQRRQDREDAILYDRDNEKVLELEEQQFQDYARRVIEHCEKGGRNTYPLKKAADAGAGGGLGPQFPGRGGVRPSYLTADKKGVQLPHYKRDSTERIKNTIDNEESTQNRLGFVWG